MVKSRQRQRRGRGTLFKRTVGGCWIARWYLQDGRRAERSTRTTDRAAAERILAKRIADVALRRDGVIDIRADRYAAAEQRPLSEHLSDWRAGLVAKGITGKQVGKLMTHVRKLLAAIAVERLGELSASAIQAAIGELHEKGWSLQTCHHYLRAVKQFSRWLKRDGRVRDDVLAHLTGFNPATDRRLERRPLDAEELGLLANAAETGPAWRGLSGVDRAMLYRVAVGTGFRRDELRSLTPASFRLDDNPPAIALAAVSEKRRRDALQPIRSDLAGLLRDWLSNKSTDGLLWPGWWYSKSGGMVRDDLRRAKGRWIKAAPDRQERRERRQSTFLEAVDSSGRLVDFHALRASYITLLVKGGTSVKVAQELARHSDPKLTLNVYTKLGVHDLVGALDTLPGVNDGGPDRERLRATGTDGTQIGAQIDPRPKPRQMGRETLRPIATSCDDGETEARVDNTRKSLATLGQFARQCDSLRPVAAHCDDAAEQAQIVDERFVRPQTDCVKDVDAHTSEHAPSTPAQNPDSSQRKYPSGAALLRIVELWGELWGVVEAWPRLPTAVRTGILAMVEASAAGPGEGER